MKRNRVNQIIERAYAERYDLRTPVPASRPQSFFYLTKVRPVLDRVEPFAAALTRKRILLSSLLLTAVVVGITIHYFNTLVISQQNMHAAEGRVQALLQRRSDVAVNLSRAVLDYAEHEKSVLSAVVALRGLSTDRQGDKESSRDPKTGTRKVDPLQSMADKAVGKPSPTQGSPVTTEAAASAGAQTPGAHQIPAWMNLAALAEQYPDLKLSANFQTLMNVLDQVEKDLAGKNEA